MFRLISDGWDSEVLGARSNNPNSLRIVCPFIEVGALARILKTGGSGHLEVITRFDLGCFYGSASGIDALRAVIKAGGSVRGIKGLHAKLFIFGSATAIGTSANITDAAMLRNHEFGFVTDGPAIVTECNDYFDRLWKLAGKDLSAAQLEGWDDALTAARKVSGRVHRPDLPDYGTEIFSALTPAPRSTPEKYDSRAFLKFFGQGSNRSPRTTQIADLVEEAGCNWACTYPTMRRPRQVGDGATLYMAHIAEPHDILIYGSAIGWRHRDNEDVANAAEIVARPWKNDWANYIRVHSARFVNAELGDGISMLQMMSELGVDSFKSTQRNSQVGMGNTDPHLAYLRKPGMLLTDVSREWINRRLDGLFRSHGQVSLSHDRFRQPT